MTDSSNSNSNSKWPHLVLLGNDNWNEWLLLYKEELHSHKQPGKDIQRNIRTIFRKVSPQDTIDPSDPFCTTLRYEHLIEETIDAHVHPHTSTLTPKKMTLRKKDQTQSPGTVLSATSSDGRKSYTVSNELSDSGTAHFIRDEDKIIKSKQEYADAADILIKMTVNSLALTTKDSVALNSNWALYRLESNSFDLFLILSEKYPHTASFRVIQVRTTADINLKQSETIEKYCQDILRAMENYRSDLCGTEVFKDHIPIDKLYQYVFTARLNLTQFGAKLENFYSTNPTGALPVPLVTLMDEYISYSNQRNISISSGPEASSALLTGNTNTGKQPIVPPLLNKDGTLTKCKEYDLWFPTSKSTAGSFYKFCKACNNIRSAANKNKSIINNTKSSDNPKPTVSNPKASDPKVLPNSVAELKALLAIAEKKEKISNNLSFFSALMDDDDDDESTSALMLTSDLPQSSADKFGFWDSACSLNLTGSFHSSMQAITPFRIDGAKKGTGIILTHKVRLIGTEFTEGVVDLYYSPETVHTLFSFGLFIRHGYKFDFPKIDGVIEHIIYIFI